MNGVELLRMSGVDIDSCEDVSGDPCCTTKLKLANISTSTYSIFGLMLIFVATITSADTRALPGEKLQEVIDDDGATGAEDAIDPENEKDDVNTQGMPGSGGDAVLFGEGGGEDE